MGGIYQSLFDNPSRFKWEPDPGKIQTVKVVPFESEDWPDEGDKGSTRITVKFVPRSPREKREEKIRVQVDLKKRCDNFRVKRDRIKKRYDFMRKAAEKVLQEQIKCFKKEIAEYKEGIVKLSDISFHIRKYVITAGHIKELLNDVDDDCIIQISRNGRDWDNCRYTMMRVLISDDIARRMVPADTKDGEKEGL